MPKAILAFQEPTALACGLGSALLIGNPFIVLQAPTRAAPEPIENDEAESVRRWVAGSRRARRSWMAKNPY